MKIKVVKEKNYAAVRATNIILEGETVSKIEGNIIPNATKFSIQLGINKHIISRSSNPNDILSIWRFINHSCEPNCFIDISGMRIVALRDINMNEEVTFDYNTTEKKMAAPFLCNCGSKNCLGYIKGSHQAKTKQEQSA